MRSIVERQYRFITGSLGYTDADLVKIFSGRGLTCNVRTLRKYATGAITSPSTDVRYMQYFTRLLKLEYDNDMDNLSEVGGGKAIAIRNLLAEYAFVFAGGVGIKDKIILSGGRKVGRARILGPHRAMRT